MSLFLFSSQLNLTEIPKDDIAACFTYCHQNNLSISHAYQEELSDERIIHLITAAQSAQTEQQPTASPIWQPASGAIDPETIVYFTHGGGLSYILRFLTGQIQGYKLEGSDRESPDRRLGLQVSPSLDLNTLSDRSSGYAFKACGFNWDYPAILVGSIKCKYLDAAPNAYEAGLRHINASNINIISLRPVYEFYQSADISLGQDNRMQHFINAVRHGEIRLPLSLESKRDEIANEWERIVLA